MTSKAKPMLENSEDILWSTYLKAAEDEDRTRPREWEGNTGSILTFTGLFAATVAAFIIESYKSLSPDSGDRTVALLSQILAATANASTHDTVILAPAEPFTVPTTSIVTNALWFSSLLIALVCALLSTLVQQWSRDYVRDISRRRVLHESLRHRAYNHIYIRMGVNRYGMDQFVSWIVALVHLSVFLFASGLLVFLYPINPIVAGIATGVLGLFTSIYIIASLQPLLDRSCPYRTPVTYLIACAYQITLQKWWIDPRLWLHNKPGESQGNLRYIVARQYQGPQDHFLTDRRFLFAWEHSYPHVTSETFEDLLKGLPSIIQLHSNWRELVSYLCADDHMMGRLSDYLRRSHPAFWNKDQSYSAVDNRIFVLVSFLSRRMFALEVERCGESTENDVFTSSHCLQILGSVSSFATVNGPSQLSASLCLSHARWSFLKLCKDALEKDVPAPAGRKEGAPSLFDQTSRNDFRLHDNSLSDLLLRLTTGFYNGYTWIQSSTSHLLPLHDHDCCKSPDAALTHPSGLAHVAACNALSTIADLLASADDQRNNGEWLMHEPLLHWDSTLPMAENAHQNIPSSDFISTLRSAGLHAWLDPGSNFTTGPAVGPNYDFLTKTPYGQVCVHALRKLAQNVDLAAYRTQSGTMSPLIPPQLPSSTLDRILAPPHDAHVIHNPLTAPPLSLLPEVTAMLEQSDTPGATELRTVMVDQQQDGLNSPSFSREEGNVWHDA
ncbi:hypothetical protein PENSPDRAFT_611823 [Peniophora sp. CONT]|nr:hypothetical protein PENSPDRAFT_611823 [Peniophora sp. CONT]